jgi:hypothetical protein
VPVLDQSVAGWGGAEASAVRAIGRGHNRPGRGSRTGAPALGKIDDGVIGAFIDQRLETERGANGPLITAVDMAEVTLLSSSAVNILLRQTHLVG